MREISEKTAQAFDEAANWAILLREEPEDVLLHQRFTAWLHADPQHEQAWTAMGQTVAAIASVPPERLSALREAARGEALPRKRRLPWRGQGRPRARRAAMPVAAGLAACLAIVLGPPLWTRMTADYVTGAGEVKSVRLPDGSMAVLGPQTAVRLSFAGAQRRVDLSSGQAYFEVRHDAAHPFTVTSGSVTTQDLGTAFDVRALGDDVRVGVESGRVRVSEGIRQVDLGAGEGVRSAAGRGLAASERQPAGLVGAWQEKKAFIRNRTIADAVDEIRPWTSARIWLADSRLAARKVTGSYDLADPAAALELIVNPYGARVVRVTPWLLIVTE